MCRVRVIERKTEDSCSANGIGLNHVYDNGVEFRDTLWVAEGSQVEHEAHAAAHAQLEYGCADTRPA